MGEAKRRQQQDPTFGKSTISLEIRKPVSYKTNTWYSTVIKEGLRYDGEVHFYKRPSNVNLQCEFIFSKNCAPPLNQRETNRLEDIALDYFTNTILLDYNIILSPN